MAMSGKRKFTTQMSSGVLAELRALAKAEGRQLQSLVDEAIEDVIAKHRNARSRPHVMAAYQASVQAYAPLYKKLAE